MRYLSTLALLFSVYIVAVAHPHPVHAQNMMDERILYALDDGDWAQARRLSQRGGNRFTRSLAQWYDLIYNPQIAHHEEYRRFLRAHPDWPMQDILRERMEISFLNDTPSTREIERWFSQYHPISPRAELLLWDAKGRVNAARLRQLWVDGDFSPKEETYMVRRYGHLITQDTHHRRIDRLIWDEHYNAAGRMLPFVSDGVAQLSTTRIAIARKKGGLNARINRLPGRLQNHPGLLFERVRFRAQRGDYDGVQELLLDAPNNLPQAAKWWPYQKRVIRDAMEDNRLRTAKTLLDKHSQSAAAELVDAEWMRGWLYLSFLNQPRRAADAFTTLYNTASMPISRARGAYWAARAYEAKGQNRSARTWYEKAATFPTTFYGQLAHQAIAPNAPLNLRFADYLSDVPTKQFITGNELAAQMVRLSANKHAHLIWPHIRHRLRESKTQQLYAGFAATARISKQLPLAIKIAREAQLQGFYLPELYPTPPVPHDLATYPALALAISRQESRFDLEARSSADARGLMQLLPSTAKRVAAAHNLPYSLDSLYDPRMNMLLGSHYISHLLSQFGDNYILAIAGYNAGPNRSRTWVKRFGALSNRDWRHNIEWVERIPFSETRNYVQRVLENYHVYQHIINARRTPTDARAMLVRGRY